MPLESGYGAPKVMEAMGTPVPVPLCALMELERAKMLASVVKAVNGAIAMGMDSVERAYGFGNANLIK